MFTSFKHYFLARSFISTDQCRGHLHDKVTSKFTGERQTNSRYSVNLYLRKRRRIGDYGMWRGRDWGLGIMVYGGVGGG